MLVFWCYLLEESPTWLLANYRARAALEVAMAAATQNGVDLEKAVATFKALKRQIRKREKVVVVPSPMNAAETYFERVRFRRSAVAVLLSWFGVNFTYYGHVLRAVSSNRLWHALQAVVQTLLYTLVWRLLHSRGQREMLSVLLSLLCGLTALKASVLLADLQWLVVPMEVVVESLSSATLSLNYGYTADIFPTVSRSMGLSFSYAFGRLGVLAVVALMEVVGRENDAVITLMITLLVLLSAMAIQSLPEVYVEKAKKSQSLSEMTEEQRKAALQASLSSPASGRCALSPAKDSSLK
ncbi:beta-alanine transporter-like [Amblyomma americanum]